MRTVTVIPIREAKNSDLELTIEEMLSDPIVKAVMRADRVDPAKLTAMLNRTASALQTRTGFGPFGLSASPSTHGSGVRSGREVDSQITHGW
jgi:hypothetical protein